MGSIFDENIEAIERGGGCVDREWLEVAREAGGRRAEAEISKDGLHNIKVKISEKQTLHLHSRFDPRGEARKAVGEPGVWRGRHAVAYGLGCGYHAEALREAVGTSGAVTVLECNPHVARAVLENVPLTALAGLPGVRLLIGNGRNIAPRAFERIRQLEAASEAPVAKLFMHKASVAALPPGEKFVKAKLGALREEVFLEGHEADPRIARAFDSIRKKRLSGAWLDERDIGLLFAESVFSEDRYFYYDSPYERGGPPGDARSILVISLNAIGDVVMASPVFSALRESYPAARVAFVTERPSQTLYERCDALDRVFSYSRKSIAADYLSEQSLKSLEKAARAFAQLKSEVAAEGIDVVFNAHPSARGAILAGALGANPENCIGHVVGPDAEPRVRGPLWTLANHLDKVPTDVRQEERKLLMFGLAPRERKLNVCVRGGGEAACAPAAESAPKRRVVGINPFASSVNRSWPQERFGELCRGLVGELDAELLIFGGADAGERAAAERLCREIGSRAAGCIGAPLDEAARAAAACDLFITNDTGPMHFSGAAGARCLAICGPTLNLPYNSIGHIAIAADMECMFCGPFPKCERPKCFEAIEAIDVLRVAETMLTKPGEESLRALAGRIGDGGFPHRLFTTGFYDSVTPRYFIRLRNSQPVERNIAAEFAELAVFNVMRRLEAEVYGSEAFAQNADARFSAAGHCRAARDEVLRRYGFSSPDMELLKSNLNGMADCIENTRGADGDPETGAPKDDAPPTALLEGFLCAAGLERFIRPALDSCARFFRELVSSL